MLQIVFLSLHEIFFRHVRSSKNFVDNDPIEALGAFNEDDGPVHAIIETPKRSAVKYSYSPQSRLFRAKRTLPHGMIFPFNFGFVPGTLAEDGDPLDILIVDPVPFLCGALVKARLLAVIEAEQTENGKMVRNDRIVAMAIDEETPPEFLSRESGKSFFSLPPTTKSMERNLRRCGLEMPKTENNLYARRSSGGKIKSHGQKQRNKAR